MESGSQLIQVSRLGDHVIGSLKEDSRRVAV